MYNTYGFVWNSVKDLVMGDGELGKQQAYQLPPSTVWQTERESPSSFLQLQLYSEQIHLLGL